MLDEVHSSPAGIRLSVDEAIDHGVVDGLGDAVGVKFLKDAFTVAFHRVKRLER